ncbi:unnamed protein product, partial [Mesorhabditis spiculigera]
MGLNWGAGKLYGICTTPSTSLTDERLDNGTATIQCNLQMYIDEALGGTESYLDLFSAYTSLTPALRYAKNVENGITNPDVVEYIGSPEQYTYYM